MPRPRKKDYDAEKVMRELLGTVDELYGQNRQIKLVANELQLAELKVKKLLITSGAIVYPQTKMLEELRQQGKAVPEIIRITGLSRASINSYLPYSKVPYKADEVSANADRCELYRVRKEAVAGIVDVESLWSCLVLFSGYTFHTVSGLKFSYEIRKGKDGKYTKELFISRKEKSITLATIARAYRNIEKGRIYTRPKELGDLFGISYIYPIFYRFGLISVVGQVR